MTTAAELTGDEYVINGRKVMISLTRVCDLAIVVARTGDRHSAFLVERGMPGFDTPNRENYPGLRGEPVGDLQDVLPLLINKLRAIKGKD